ncbi:MAG TPA: hypothetical protein VK578_21960 [Edaphobacter sp.]|nr:hypothetical protein [Edaphobacter sp.]
MLPYATTLSLIRLSNTSFAIFNETMSQSTYRWCGVEVPHYPKE